MGFRFKWYLKLLSKRGSDTIQSAAIADSGSFLF